VSAGRLLTVHGVQADVVELEQLDDAGVEWFAVGPAGEAIGALAEVLPGAIGSGGDADWIAAVIAAIERHGLDWRRMAEAGSPAASSRNGRACSSAQIWKTRTGSQRWAAGTLSTSGRSS